jgi:hypothetical protein
MVLYLEGMVYSPISDSSWTYLGDIVVKHRYVIHIVCGRYAPYVCIRSYIGMGMVYMIFMYVQLFVNGSLFIRQEIEKGIVI